MNEINGIFKDYIAKIYIPQVEAYERWIFQKFTPLMDADSIEVEAEELAGVEWNRVGSLPSDGSDLDMSSVAERVNEDSINYYSIMTDLMQGLYNLFAVGLYHIFEQQMLRFYRKELLDYNEERCVEWLFRKYNTLDNKEQKALNQVLSMNDLDSKLRSKGIEVSECRYWGKITELRRLANTIKHADGNSCEQLKKHRPDLFLNPLLKEETFFRDIQIETPVFQPLAGENIFVNEDVLLEYIASIKGFWMFVINDKEVI